MSTRELKYPNDRREWLLVLSLERETVSFHPIILSGPFTLVLKKVIVSFFFVFA